MGFSTYLAMGRLQVRRDLMYRLDLLISLLVVPTIIGVNYFIWKAVFETQHVVAGFTFDGMMQYIILGQLISIFIYNSAAIIIQQLVQSGDLTRELLLRPINPIGSLFAMGVGNRAVAFFLEVLPLGLISIFFFAFTLPNGLPLLLFVVSMILAFVLNFFISLIIGLTAFWTIRVEAFQWLTWIIVRVLSGEFFPLTLFPAWLQTASHLLPFEYMRFRVALIAIDGDVTAALWTMAGQIIWIILMGALAALLWRIVVRRYTTAGG